MSEALLVDRRTADDQPNGFFCWNHWETGAQVQRVFAEAVPVHDEFNGMKQQ